MKLNTKELKESLLILKKIVDLNPKKDGEAFSQPVYQNVLLEKDDKYLNLTAINQNEKLIIRLLSSSEESEIFNNITVNLNYLLSVVKTLKNKEINIISFNNNLIVDSFKINNDLLIGSDKFNCHFDLSIKKDEQTFNTKEFQKALEFCIDTTCNYDQNNILSTVCLYKSNTGRNYASSTNGNVLRYYQIEANLKENINIPRLATKNLIKILNFTIDNKFTLDIYRYRIAKYETTNYIYVFNILEGTFPRWEQLIADYEDREYYPIKIEIEAKEFLNKMVQLKPFLNKRTFITKLEIKNKELNLIVENNQLELSCNLETDIENYIIAFNYKYLEDYLKLNKKETIEIFLSKNNYSAIYLRIKNTDNNLFLIMPIPIR